MRQGDHEHKPGTFPSSRAHKWRLTHMNKISKPNNIMKFGKNKEV
jgi:hypothetical protein